MDEHYALHDRIADLEKDVAYLRGLIAVLIWEVFPREGIERLLKEKDVTMLDDLLDAEKENG